MSLARIWARLAQRRLRAGYHSRFGGLWTDRLGALESLRRKCAHGEVSTDEERALVHWIEHGYWIIPSALSWERIDALSAEIDALWESAEGGLLVEIGGEVHRYGPELRDEHCKLVDVYVRSRVALEIALDERLQRFLRLVFEEAPLLFQSLSFERGSEQPAHQDTAYVVVTPPLALAAAWIALEDVRPGCGELFYYPGSHRLRDRVFRGGGRSWSRERDGVEAQARYHSELLERTTAKGLVRESFCPRKGDVLFWSADLVHGGSPIVDRTLSRRSLACHYCPVTAKPYYFSYLPKRRALGSHPSGARWASSHYEVST